MAEQRTIVVAKEDVRQKLIPINSPIIKKLIGTYEKLDLEGQLENAERIAKKGMVLQNMKVKITRGEWIEWLETSKYCHPRKAQVEMKVADYARDHPGFFKKFKVMGPSIVHHISGWPEKVQKVFAMKESFALPGGKGVTPRKALTITDVKYLGKKLMRKPLWDPEARKKALYSKARGLRKDLEDLEDHGETISGELAIKIQKEWGRIVKVWQKVKR